MMKVIIERRLLWHWLLVDLRMKMQSDKPAEILLKNLTGVVIM